ncbi:beta-1,6-N-acetylglucosaminyltransferase [Tatumella sp. JGM118]|uniref:beta-1,6-N-acetylglucosaminyltransferase n=1 Tax=Tatumella sp. JGM118 TaxID=2799796 RepID=UPI001BAFAD0B|nr:beta-1,6-N-acetylglucosaminyltransferase [Tatumella sp. JGM118]MBS0910036.1 core-2/I-branching enzyme [Tatumella sp. JGM118]
MKIIYAITCHEVTDPLLYTVNELSSCKDNLVIIHVDKKSDLQQFSSIDIDNVFFLQDRVDICWGTFSQIEATYKLLSYAYKLEFDYFFLLSGDDIPLTSQKDLTVFLKDNSGYEFFEFQSENDNYVNPLERVKYKYPFWYFKRKKNIYNKIKSKAFDKLKFLFFRNKCFLSHHKEFPELYKGSNWFGMSYQCVEYVIDYIKNNTWYYDSFIHSYCCDEVFFHTIIKTWSDIKLFDDETIASNSLRYIDWKTGPEYPRILQPSDRLKIKESRCFFARKIPKVASDEYMRSFRKDSLKIEV